MESIAANSPENPAQENVRKYFREVMQKHQLPALPAQASTRSMRVLGIPYAQPTFTKSGNETPLSGLEPVSRPKKLDCVLRIERYPPLFSTKSLMGSWWCLIVCSS